MKIKELLNTLGEFEGVSNIQSNNGNNVPNQFILNFERGTVFQSYGSIIAISTKGNTYLTQAHDYSVTTSKYRNLFLNDDSKGVKEGLKGGSYILLED